MRRKAQPIQAPGKLGSDEFRMDAVLQSFRNRHKFGKRLVCRPAGLAFGIVFALKIPDLGNHHEFFPPQSAGFDQLCQHAADQGLGVAIGIVGAGIDQIDSGKQRQPKALPDDGRLPAKCGNIQIPPDWSSKVRSFQSSP